MAGIDEPKKSLEERVAFLERELGDTREYLGMLLSYLQMNHEFDRDDFVKWCRFLIALRGDPNEEFRVLHSIIEIIEDADGALEAREGRVSYRDFSR
ncbi:hypothetical protein [Labrenzia sp. DG1229]|uniref:hypothetical protein n=1 Tax=Labrenzia sp. DG1229 TaxID=681847 RepID=UPI0004908269|nr:hypothetical protein [Labrenzia sp. DG1229]